MKKIMIIAVFALFANIVAAQTTGSVSVVVKGIKEHKGKIMVAIGDKNNADPKSWQAGMFDALSDIVICEFKAVPVGVTNIYVFQDINGNYIMDFNAEKRPVELCAAEEKVEIKEGKNTVHLTLTDYSKNTEEQQ